MMINETIKFHWELRCEDGPCVIYQSLVGYNWQFLQIVSETPLPAVFISNFRQIQNDIEDI